MKTVYKKWKTQKGKGLDLELLEFIDYYRENNKIYKFIEDGITYIGEIWEGEDEFGNRVEIKIRVKYNPDLFNKELQDPIPPHLVDTWYNPIVDPQDYIHSQLEGKEANRTDFLNEELEERSLISEKKLANYKRVLKKIIKKDNKGLYNYVKLKISFLTSPDYIKFRQLQRMNNKFNYQEQVNEINNNLAIAS